MKKIVTTNYGLKKGKLDATVHVARLIAGQNGYTNMDTYNRQAPWNGKRS